MSRPSIDAIGEFKVVTSPSRPSTAARPAARSSSPPSRARTGSRGTVYDYFRNDSSTRGRSSRSGRIWTRRRTTRTSSAPTSAGRLSQNRAFFFADFEATRITQGVLRTGRVVTATSATASSRPPIRDPLTGSAVRRTTPSPQDRIDPVARNIVAHAADAERRPAPTTSSASRTSRTTASGTCCAPTSSRGTNDNVFVRYIYTDRTRFVPGFLGGMLDGTSTSAWGRNFLKSHSTVGGWTKVLRPTLVNEFRVVVGARASRTASRIRSATTGWRRSVPGRARRSGRCSAASSAWTSRVTSGSGRRTSCRSISTPIRSSTSNTLTWLRGNHQRQVRHRHHGADEQRVHGHPVHARQPRLQRAVHRQRVRRLPARLRAAGAELSNVHIVNQRRWAMAFFVQDDWRVEPAADAQPRSALRLHDAVLRGGQPDGELRSGRPARWCSPATARSRIARWSSPTATTSAPRLGVVYQVTDQHGAPRRLRHVLQPARPHRVRRSARAEPAGPAQHQPDHDVDDDAGAASCRTGSRPTTSIRRTSC